MELRHLRYFKAVADRGHMTRAAQHLGIAQPALTQQIKSLELELGVDLFDRVGRHLELTQAGTLLHAEAALILGRVDAAVSLVRQTGKGLAGRLHVGFTESASFSPVVTAVLKGMRTRWPSIEMLLQESHTEQLTKALAEGLLDLAFVRPPLRQDPSLSFKELLTERMVVAMPSEHRLARRDEVGLEELVDEAFILYPRSNGPGLSDRVVAACAQAGFSPRVAQRAPQLSSTVNLVATALGVAVVPGCMRHLRTDHVSYPWLRGDALRAQLGVAFRRDDGSVMTRNMLAVIDACVASAA